MSSPHKPDAARQRTSPATAFRRTHGGEQYPATLIHQYIREHGIPDAGGIARLASQTGLPASTLRATLSHYADYAAQAAGDDPCKKICHGTSCFLSAAGNPPPPATGMHVSCLGHCHQESNYLFNDRVETTAAQTETSIQCLAPQAVTTRRFLTGKDGACVTSSYAGLHRALELSPEHVLEMVTASGLRGRGGAAFPTGTKWQACADSPSDQRYIVANGNEGDPGSYVDRILLERDPHSVIEGMLIGAHAMGASKGVIYIRSEYPAAIAIMEEALKEARQAGHFQSESFSCEISVVEGAGSFVCGEETALINSIEGLRGEVRLRPPYPTQAGLFGKPTAVDNIETLCNIPYILEHGSDAYRAMGTQASAGTKTLCFNHGFVRPGIVEVEFGTPLQTAIDAVGGSKEPLAAILLGGPMGCVMTPDTWDTPVCYQAMQERGLDLGHGSIIALPKSADKLALLRHWLTFMVDESCGKCEPCSLGSVRSRQIVSEPLSSASRAQLGSLLHLIGQTSLCAFGREIPRALSEYLEIFSDEIFTPGSP
ncbi:MAG: complex I 51 kDa subunit family protein [Akkermansiaceae bacterium]